MARKEEMNKVVLFVGDVARCLRQDSKMLHVSLPTMSLWLNSKAI